MDLKEYLRRVYELEKSCYEQESLTRKLENHLTDIQRQAPEQRKLVKVPDVPGAGARTAVGISQSLKFILKCTVFSAAIPGFIVAILGDFLGIRFSNSFEVFSVLIPGCLGLLISILVSISSAGSYSKKSYIEEREAAIQANQEAEAYNQAQQAAKALAVAQAAGQVEQASGELAATLDTLHKFYAADIIFPKYRNFVAVSMFYEYLCSGRCSALEGHEGAYNIYEQEIRMNLILSKLDEVIAHLDRIEDNQYMLASAIREGNAKADQIYRTLQNVESNTAASAYFSEVSAMNTTYMAWFRKNL